MPLNFALLLSFRILTANYNYKWTIVSAAFYTEISII